MRDEDYPALFRAADASSRAAQQRFFLVTRIRLLGLVVAAIGGAFTFVVGRVDVYGFVALIAFVAALGAELYLLAEKPDQVWYSGRAAAETAKTLTWRYVTGGRPFPIGIDDADQMFLARLNDILHDLHDLDLAPLLSADQQITPQMSRLRALDLDSRKQTYRDGRIDDQRTWYASKASYNARRSSRWSMTALVLECAGVVAAAAKAFTAIQLDVLGLLAAAAAAFTAWAQAKQFQTLSRAYFVASQELATIRSHLDRPSGEDEWASLVEGWEEAISREHTLWRAAHASRPQAL